MRRQFRSRKDIEGKWTDLVSVREDTRLEARGGNGKLAPLATKLFPVDLVLDAHRLGLGETPRIAPELRQYAQPLQGDWLLGSPSNLA